jgi:hypothetical protein
MMPRATKIGKTLIDMSIKTGDRIVVGKKDNKVHVDLLNPTADMLKDCAVDDETALQAKLEAEKIAEATLLQQKSTHEHAPSDKELFEPIAAEPDTPATVAEESKEDSTETEKQKSLDALADKALKAK